MKNLKRFASLALVLVMALSMSITAFAADTTNITVKEKDSDAAVTTYKAYRLLDATNAVDEEKKATDKFSYTLREDGKYVEILKSISKTESQADIIDYISKLDDDATRTFADNVYDEIQKAGIAADYTSAEGKFSNVPQGYYLIAETEVGDHPDVFSLVMLDTAGKDDITVTTKENPPTVEKKVQDTNDSTGETSGWQDSADYDIGDEIPYQITGTVSSDIAKYKTYYYEFVDSMTHLTYVTDSAKVMIGENDVTDQFTINWNDSDKTLTAKPNNDGNDLLLLKDANSDIISITKDTKVVLTYKATLDDDANIGPAGNPNDAYLKYNRNPYYDGNGENKPGETPKDKNIVFTYEGIVNKVDGQKQPLMGAEFTLYKFDKEENKYVEYKNKLTVGDDGTTFTAKGLDDGKYKIVETKVPDGYNKAADIEFTITATHSEEADEPVLLTLTVDNTNVTPDKEKGQVSTDVENNSGTELPSTGGIGTTIFYTIGGLLVVGAGVVMITKRRMEGN